MSLSDMLPVVIYYVITFAIELVGFAMLLMLIRTLNRSGEIRSLSTTGLIVFVVFLLGWFFFRQMVFGLVWAVLGNSGSGGSSSTTVSASAASAASAAAALVKKCNSLEKTIEDQTKEIKRLMEQLKNGGGKFTEIDTNVREVCLTGKFHPELLEILLSRKR